ncbi:MAG: di-trans,poly-cis-decaprenylcistransferase [Candidatus Levybacteria bacterium RIFCSPHIGHO2_01_FULL_40_15b]|nr:MAG: di-trans,poly-cis-decaprenylcistransferase [Candidatus Levybacteria bacterium RIFCSPHIGHO2_01_FULL_40_15b]
MNPTPNHIAIIPDGNRRWAREHGLPTLEGHRRGFEAARKIVKYARDVGIHTLTLWAFSTENWTRTKEEVSYLMKLYAEMTDKFLDEAVKDEVRVIHLGRKDRIPEFLLKRIKNGEEKTRNFTRNILNIAFDYGGRDEILRAIGKIRNSNSGIREEKDIEKYLDTADQPYPDPDLILRTSGEMRISGLMIWQAAYSELLFLNKHFPEMTTSDIDFAIEEYKRRQRRFGK